MAIELNQTTPETASRQDRKKIVEIRDLKMHFPVKKGMFSREGGWVHAVDGVSFDIYEGETLGLVGESGSGKTTIGRTLMRVYEPTAGEMIYHRETGETVDLATANKGTLRNTRKEIRMVFQDPFASLNPRMSLRDIVAEPLRGYGTSGNGSMNQQIADLLKRVGLRPEYMRRFPHAFSGGERQRVGIARALATNPRLLVADEPVSALDVSVRAQIINLLRDLQNDLGLTYLFISHDLSVVEHICDRVAVMYLGRIVELTETKRIFANPKMPYTESLLSAVPIADPRQRGAKSRIMLEGEMPDPANPPAGCAFHTRCRYATELCQRERPELREVESGHWAACHYADTLQLQGASSLREQDHTISPRSSATFKGTDIPDVPEINE